MKLRSQSIYLFNTDPAQGVVLPSKGQQCTPMYPRLPEIRTELISLGVHNLTPPRPLFVTLKFILRRRARSISNSSSRASYLCVLCSPLFICVFAASHTAQINSIPAAQSESLIPHTTKVQTPRLAIDLPVYNQPGSFQTIEIYPSNPDTAAYTRLILELKGTDDLCTIEEEAKNTTGCIPQLRLLRTYRYEINQIFIVQ